MRSKIYTITFFCLLFVQGQVFAQQPMFDEANSHLREGNYQQAIEIYQSIAGSGYESGALWQNLGVAYTRLDSLGKAKYYFLQAENFSETEEQAKNALAFVNNQFPRQSAVLPALPWVRFINFLSENFGIKTMALTALLMLYLGIALKIGSWFRLDFKKPMSYGSYAVMVISGLLFLFSFVIQYQQNHYSTGVMIDREANVYQQPEENSSVISTAFEGYTLKVYNEESEDSPNWTYVRLENGMHGWIQSDHIMMF